MDWISRVALGACLLLFAVGGHAFADEATPLTEAVTPGASALRVNGIDRLEVGRDEGLQGTPDDAVTGTIEPDLVDDVAAVDTDLDSASKDGVSIPGPTAAIAGLVLLAILILGRRRTA